jgi:hypothetical protein
MPAYDSNLFDPPAPVAVVNLRDPGSGNTVNDVPKFCSAGVTLDLIFLKRTIRGKYVVVDSSVGILGRDVLNHLAILLDGPSLSWQEQNDSPK